MALPAAADPLADFSQQSAPHYTNIGRIVVALNQRSGGDLFACWRVWVALHHLNHCDPRRPGWVDLGDPAQRQRLSDVTGLQWNRLRVIIAGGVGAWWRWEASRLCVASPQKIAGWLKQLADVAGLRESNEQPVKVAMPLELLRAGKQELTAFCFDTWLEARMRGNMGYQARWQDLRQLWLHTDQHMRRWMKQAGVIAEHVKGFLPLAAGLHQSEIEEIAANPAAHGYPAHGEVGSYKGQYYLYFRRANRWHSRNDRRTRPGRVFKISKALNRSADEQRPEVTGGSKLREPGPSSSLRALVEPAWFDESVGERCKELEHEYADRGGLSAIMSRLQAELADGWIRLSRRNYVLDGDGRDVAFQKARRKRPFINMHLRRALTFNGQRWASFYLFSPGSKA